jgi:hypothetical protein
MALALTGSRLLVLGITQPIAMGKGRDVKGLVSAAPLTDVESIEVKRLLVGKTVTITVRGVPVKLEVGASGDAKIALPPQPVHQNCTAGERLLDGSLG